MPPATKPAPGKPAPAAYMPQLDGLRALAVFGVLVTHIYYTGEGHHFPWGYLGVRLFFVLSGFLITGILLDCKALMESHQQSLGFTLRRFYIRRALRILPPFYLAVAAVSIAGLYHMREMIPWHLVHICNFYYAYQGRWPHPGLHFWSLAVEEQFYFLWPCLILIVRREHLQRFILITIALGPIYRAAACAAGFNDIAVTMLPFGCLDTLGAGALLAVWSRTPHWNLRLRQLTFWALCVGVPLFVILSILRAKRMLYPVWTTGEDLVLALIFTALVGQSARGIAGLPGKLLMLPPLRAMGKISYAIYVYHIFLIYPFLRYGHRIHYQLPDSGWQRLFVVSALTLAVATASWFLVERPINGLKRYFPYSHRTARKPILQPPAPELAVSTSP